MSESDCGSLHGIVETRVSCGTNQKRDAYRIQMIDRMRGNKSATDTTRTTTFIHLLQPSERTWNPRSSRFGHYLLLQPLESAAFILRPLNGLLELLFSRLQPLLHPQDQHADLLDVRQCFELLLLLIGWSR